MEIIDGAVIITCLWSIIIGGYLYIQTWSMKSKEIETLKEEGRQLRQQMKPREWWQEILVEAAKNPDLIDKVSHLSGNPGIVSLLEKMKQGR